MAKLLTTDDKPSSKRQHIIHRRWGNNYRPPKSYLIFKEGYIDEVKQLFEGTNITITTNGARHLGTAFGLSDFKEFYVKKKVSQWCHEIENLASIASSHPHAAFTALIHGEQHKWSWIQSERDSATLLIPFSSTPMFLHY